MQGDILLFTGSSSDVVDRIIMWRTHGRYTHVEVDVGDGYSIAALTRGVVKHEKPSGGNCVPVATSQFLTDVSRLADGIAFLEKHVGDKYGWLDIVNQGISLFFPYGPFLFESNLMDCSNLTASFLWIAGYPLAAGDIDTQLVTPNDIARALRVKFSDL